jgi:NADH:ubiquinone oxidoreductase subunit C
MIDVGKVYRKGSKSCFVEVPLKELDAIWPKLIEAGVTRISSMTVNDCGKQLEVIYHFVHDGEILNIKTTVSSSKPQVKSIVRYYPGAELIERELWETMGVEPVGHPRLEHFLLDGKRSPKHPGLKEGKK